MSTPKLSESTRTAALRIRRQQLGSENIDVAATIYNTGQTNHQMGEINEAMSLYQEFLTVAKARLGSEHCDLAIMYKCTAQIHQERNEFDIAKQMVEKVLTTGRAALGNFHPEVASTLNKIGNFSYELGHMTSAMSYYKEGLKVERAVLRRHQSAFGAVVKSTNP